VNGVEGGAAVWSGDCSNWPVDCTLKESAFLRTAIFGLKGEKVLFKDGPPPPPPPPLYEDEGVTADGVERVSLFLKDVKGVAGVLGITGVLGISGCWCGCGCCCCCWRRWSCCCFAAPIG